MAHSDISSSDMPGGTQVVARVALLLRLLASNHLAGLTLTEAGALSGLETSTAQRLLKGLVSQRLAVRDVAKRYHLGMLTFELGLAAGQRNPLVERMRPVLTQVADRTGDTVYLVVRSGDETVCLLRQEGHFPIRTLILDVGGRRPLGLGGGSLHLLAQFDDVEVERVIAQSAGQYPRYHNIDADILRNSVREARRVGYGLTHSRLTQGVSGVGIAIPADAGLPYAAIGIACISQRLDDAHCTLAVQAMRSALTGQ